MVFHGGMRLIRMIGFIRLTKMAVILAKKHAIISQSGRNI